MRKLLRGLRALVFWRRLDRDIQRELDFHIAMESDQRARAGVAARDARRSALRDFGEVTRVKEEVRDTPSGDDVLGYARAGRQVRHPDAAPLAGLHSSPRW